jgi:hypothetical protein
VNLQQQSVRNCCKTSVYRLTEAEVREHGTEVFLNHPALKARRQEMLEGIRNDACQVCWDMEDAGVQSPRDVPRDLSELRRFGGTELTESKRPQVLDVELSNLCDAKCVHCNRIFSSSWLAEDIKLGKVPEESVRGEFPENTELFEHRFFEWLEQSCETLEQICFIGGEPLINPRYYEILARLTGAFSGPAKPLLVTISNLNAPPRYLERFLEFLPEVTKGYRFNLDASMDAFGARGEYLRFGVSWERWLGNIRRILETRPVNFELGFQIAISALSVTSLKELLTLIRDLRGEFKIPMPLRPSVVSWPAHLSPSILTPEFAAHLYECADFVEANADPALDSRFHRFPEATWSGYAKFLRTIGDSIARGRPDAARRGEFYRWSKANDAERGTSFEAVFPEYREFRAGSERRPDAQA